jgi:NAD(P)-dependent dehydrogenase (short-subunit alcohol dehydrogenase family)
LGAHFAEVLARAGAHVILAARREVTLQRLAAEIAGRGGAASTATLDVTRPASIEALTEKLSGLDILINNAGIVHDAPALEQSESDWDGVVDTNLKGAFFVAQAAARAMRAHGRGGSIVNIASILGLRQAGRVLPYAVSKAGIIQLTKTLALEWARHKIRVNALAPGYIHTALNDDFFQSDAGNALVKRIPVRRPGRLEDLDGPLLLLASDDSSYMTGAVIAVDGGHLVSSL